MQIRVDTSIPYGNACDIETSTDGDSAEVAFAADPHGGPECLWFCFRVFCDVEGKSFRLRLKNPRNMLGGHDLKTFRPVIRTANDGTWQRLGEGEQQEYPDGRAELNWSINVRSRQLDVAYCYPYGLSEVESLLSETGSYWRRDHVGVSQGARPLIRLSNSYGDTDRTRPGIFLLARQHSGETPGSWALDGMVRALADMGDRAPLTWALPLTNIDGIEQGDYGKDNFPWDLNRAWGRPAMRHETHVYRLDVARWKTRCRPMLAIDFHSPGVSETSGVFIFAPNYEISPELRGSLNRAAECVRTALGSEYAADDFLRVPNYPSRWQSPMFSQFCFDELKLPALSVEVPYALARERVLDVEDYLAIGRRFADAVGAYVGM